MKTTTQIKTEMEKHIKQFAVTGTFNGSIVFCESEGEARRIFHKHYNGESILFVRVINSFNI